ncbi:MAG TPA: FtsW/RodA/SpoVE family cell cycle protein, partial [Clostridia bacterium]|nr:FtsW/RodA/SpoVE family cell cycle protein [Clostridia bacterium]
IQNIGMTMGVMPVTGVTLPFMSYGGSSLIISMVAIGLILGISVRRQKIKF